MSLSLTQLSIILIVLIALGAFAVRLVKNRKNFDPLEALHEFTGLAADITKRCLTILTEEDISKYNTEDEFRKALAKEVAEELIRELEGTSLAKYIGGLIKEETIIEFIESVFKLYEKDIKISDIFKTSILKSLDMLQESGTVPVTKADTEAKAAAIEVVEHQNGEKPATRENTTDITKEINNFYEGE
jgi:hypothetical protein